MLPTESEISLVRRPPCTERLPSLNMPFGPKGLCILERLCGAVTLKSATTVLIARHRGPKKPCRPSRNIFNQKEKEVIFRNVKVGKTEQRNLFLKGAARRRSRCEGGIAAEGGRRGKRSTRGPGRQKRKPEEFIRRASPWKRNDRRRNAQRFLRVSSCLRHLSTHKLRVTEGREKSHINQTVSQSAKTDALNRK